MATLLPYQISEITAEERERLILEHLPQVRWVAHRIHEKLPGTVSLDDLVSVGIIGLIAAIDNFNPSYNVKLSTYAEHRIRGAILDSIRGLDGFTELKRKRIKQAGAAIARLEQNLQRAPEEEEIAAELNISLPEYHEWLMSMRAMNVGSLDAAIDDGEGATFLDYVADREENSPAWRVERSRLEGLLAEAIATLPRIEQTVLQLYYKEELNLREIAPIVNLHLTRVAQLKAQAVLRLRAYMEKMWPSPKGKY